MFVQWLLGSLCYACLNIFFLPVRACVQNPGLQTSKHVDGGQGFRSINSSYWSDWFCCITLLMTFTEEHWFLNWNTVNAVVIIGGGLWATLLNANSVCVWGFIWDLTYLLSLCCLLYNTKTDRQICWEVKQVCSFMLGNYRMDACDCWWWRSISYKLS